jgi:serine/threonine-protein kinase
MSTVYLAEDLFIGRKVAIKVIVEERLKKSVSIIEEGTALASLNHPNLVTVFGVDTFGGLPCLMMEYLHGENLAERLTSGPLSANESIGLAIQIADALEHVHGAGLTHRDIKPGNIVFTARGAPKLIDFGISRQTITVNRASSNSRGFDSGFNTFLAGTPPYLSPESLDGEGSGECRDLWALAVVMCECLAGVNPFRGHNLADTLRRIRAHRRQHIHRLLRGSPVGIVEFVARALSENPSERPQSAGAFRIQLSEVGHAYTSPQHV